MKLTKAQQAALATLKTHNGEIRGEFVTNGWKLSYKSGGFLPTTSIRGSVVRGLVEAGAITLIKNEKGILTYKASHT